MSRLNKDMVRVIAQYAAGIDDKTCLTIGATCTWIRKILQSDIDCVDKFYNEGHIDQRIMDRRNGVLKISKSNEYKAYSDLKGHIEISIDHVSLNLQNNTLTCFNGPAIIVAGSHCTLCNYKVKSENEHQAPIVKWNRLSV